LLSNAVKFTPAGGRVSVAMRKDERGGAVIAVADTGIGIAREHLARVGEPFWQVDKGQTPKFGGSGLGLSITKSLVELHGGTLEFESEVGRGTTASVRLPAVRVLV
jgi:signal transduction histidine kinase